MRKGFTLIELLAVVVILAIVLAIAIPGVSQIIDSTKYSTFNDDEQLLIRSTKNYISFGNANEPQNIGDTVEITLSQLKSAGLISDIVSPWDKNTNCNGYVLITKTDSNKYDYEPYLNCVNNIGSKANDGLVAHWTFDDYQEPTQNLSPALDLYISEHFASRTFSNTISNYNTPLGERVTVKIESTVSATDTAFDIHSSLISVNSNKTYTFSFYSMTDDSGFSYWERRLGSNYDTIIIWYDNTGAEISRNYFDANKPIALNKWERFSITATSPANATSARLYIGADGPNLSAGKGVWITATQFEQKVSATPYVDGTREGLVIDYSGNGNNSTLQLSTTPRWVEDSKSGAGAYLFDGIDDYISISHNSSLMPSSITVSGWLKFSDGENGHWMMINKGGYGTSGAYYLYSDSLYNVTWSIFGPNGARYNASFNISLEKNKWYYLAGNFDASTGIMKLYIDGIMKSKTTGAALGSNTDDVIIGKYNTSDYYTAGTIDDVRIYNRALTDAEIKKMYDIENNK